jgi:hypothetical protein
MRLQNVRSIHVLRYMYCARPDMGGMRTKVGKFSHGRSCGVATVAAAYLCPTRAQAVGAADKVCKWVARKSALPPPASPVTPATCEGELRLENVRFRYALRPETLVLDGLSLHAKPGEVVALCGPSGGGKSSVIAIIERFYEPEVRLFVPAYCACHACLLCLPRPNHAWLPLHLRHLPLSPPARFLPFPMQLLLIAHRTGGWCHARRSRNRHA